MLSSRKLIIHLLLGVLTVIVLTVLGTLLGALALNHFGSVQGLEQWRQSHYWTLLAWRLLLYGALIIAWIRIKQRRQLNQSDRRQVRRIEVLIGILVLLIELSKAYVHSGGAA